MPFYGDRFIRAVKGYPPLIKWAYVEVSWFYWAETHCAGIPNDNDFMREVSGVTGSEWRQVKPVIFGRYFKLEDASDLWHLDFLRDEHARKLAIYSQQCDRANRARLNRGALISSPDISPNIRTDSNADVNAQPKPEREPYPERDPKRLNDAKGDSPSNSHGLNVNRSSLNRSKEKELMGRLREALGETEMAQSGGHWLVNHVRKHPEKVESGLAELKVMNETDGVRENPAGWLQNYITKWA